MMQFSSMVIFFFLFGQLLAQQTVGLFQNDSLTLDGYTLFGNNETTYLIDNCGFVINTWESDFDPGQAIYLLEDSNLLRTAKISGSFTGGGIGGRFELFNWKGELLWYYHYADNVVHTHHDIEPLPNGNFLAIAWEKHPETEAKQLGRIYDNEVWSERIVEIEMVGSNQANIVWEWHLWDHLIQNTDSDKPNFGSISGHPELIDINYIGEGEKTYGDWIHANAIAYNEDLDQIAISSRNFSEIWIIDHSTTTEKAATHSGGRYGKGGDLLYRYGNPQTYDRGVAQDQYLFHQHDVKWIPQGYPLESKLMVFNNDAAENASSVEIWTAPTDQNGFYIIENPEAFGPLTTDWKYSDENFYSKNMAGAHSLPNGNIFICEGREGRFFEITPDKEIVWEYINPVNKNGSPTAQGGTARFNEVFRATKYPADYHAFEGKDLRPGPPVELNPWQSDCDTSIIKIPEEVSFAEFNIIGNPFSELMILNCNFSESSAVFQLIGLEGRMHEQIKIYNGKNEVSFSQLPSGIYFLRFLLNGEIHSIQKVVKH